MSKRKGDRDEYSYYRPPYGNRRCFQAHVENRLHEAVSKYFERSAEINVTFSKQGHEFQAACALHLDSGLYLHASGAAQDVYACFDQSIGKIEKQLRRYKRRLKNHHDQKRFDAVY